MLDKQCYTGQKVKAMPKQARQALRQLYSFVNNYLLLPTLPCCHSYIQVAIMLIVPDDIE